MPVVPGWAPLVGAPLIALLLTAIATWTGRLDIYGLSQLGLLALPIIALLQCAGRRAWPAVDPLAGMAILSSAVAGFSFAVVAPTEGVGAALWFITGSCLPWVVQVVCRPVPEARGALLWRMGLVAVAGLAISAVVEALRGGFQARQMGWWGFGNVNVAMALSLPVVAATAVLALAPGAGRWRRLALPMVGLLLVAAIALATGRRSVGVVLAVGVLGVAAGWSARQRWLLPALIGGLLVAPLLVAAGVLPTTGDIPRDLLLRAGWDAWLAAPWLGSGAVGPVVLATSDVETARILAAGGIWTHHCHTLLLEWLVRCGVVGGVLQLALWLLAAWRVANEPDPWLRRALAVLLATHTAYAALDPAGGELSGLLLAGLVLTLCRGARDAVPTDGVGRTALLIPLLAAGALLPWAANRLAMAAFIAPEVPIGTLVRAAEKSIDPVTTARLLQRVDQDSRTPASSPVFLLFGSGLIRHEIGSAGPFLPSLRLAALANRSPMAYHPLLIELLVRQPFDEAGLRQLDALFRGRPPLSVPAPLRRRMAWLTGREPLPAALSAPRTLDDAADVWVIGLVAGLDLGRFADAAPVVGTMLTRYGAIPAVAQWGMACALRTPTLDLAALPAPDALIRWSLGVGGRPVEAWVRDAGERERAQRLAVYWTGRAPLGPGGAP